MESDVGRIQDEDGKYKLPESDVVAIKQEIVGLMISVPPTLQVQLGEAVSIIAESDFHERWDTLIDVRGSYGCTYVLLMKIGPRLSPHARQHPGKQRCAPGSACHLQAMATTLPVRPAVY